MIVAIRSAIESPHKYIVSILLAATHGYNPCIPISVIILIELRQTYPVLCKDLEMHVVI